ncbi:MAG: TIGR02444 family protein [Gammaproteobacteria bacterium]|nr:TIGR02444 family protein [Gammaproteobacteria bacterium]
MQFPRSAFWDFSVRYYQSAGVEANCLRLQDQYHLNVNLLLFCHWLGVTKQSVLTVEQWQQIISAALPWDETIAMLRKSRKLIGTANIAWPSDFKQKARDNVINIELNTEHMQQLAIEQAWLEMPHCNSDDELETIISSNLSHYLSASGSDCHLSDIQKPLQTMISAAQNLSD